MLNEPSGFRLPALVDRRDVLARAVGNLRFQLTRRRAAPPRAHRDGHRERPIFEPAFASRVYCCCCCCCCIACDGVLRSASLLLELVVVEPDVADPRERHVVDRPLAEAGPVLRIRVVDVVRRVVVPARDLEDRSLRQERRGIVGVVVDDVPAELVAVDAAERLHPAVGIDRLHALRLAAIVQVRLERRDARVLVQARVAFGPDVVDAGREIHVVVVAGVRRLVVVLRRVALRVEVQRDLARVGLRFTDRVVVHVEADLRARFHQPPGAFAERCRRSCRPRTRRGTARRPRRRRVQQATPSSSVVLHQVADEVMRDLLVADARLGLDRAQPAVFGESGLDDVVAPPVGALRRDLRASAT